MNGGEKINEFITKNELWIKIGVLTLAALLIGGACFFAGRAYAEKNMKPKIQIEYVKGDTVTDTVYVPEPYEVIKPLDTVNFITQIFSAGLYSEVFPHRVDTVIQYIPTKDDSSAVIKDYLTKRVYNETFFDNDTLGKFDFRGEVQYNRLMSYDYSFTPMQKNITVTKYVVKKYSPFIGGGVSTQPAVIAQGGMFFDEKYGFAIQYDYNWTLRKNDFGALFIYKF